MITIDRISTATDLVLRQTVKRHIWVFEIVVHLILTFLFLNKQIYFNSHWNQHGQV